MHKLRSLTGKTCKKSLSLLYVHCNNLKIKKNKKVKIAKDSQLK